MVYLFSIVLSLFNTIFRGYLIATFWAWFVMSQFVGLPALTVITAIGLSCFVGIMTPIKSLTSREYKDLKDNHSTDDQGVLNLVNNGIHVFGLLISWGVGAIVHAFM